MMTNDYGTNSDDIQWPKSKPWMPPSYLLMPKEIMNNQSFDLTYVMATGGGRGQIKLICSFAGQGRIALENWKIPRAALGPLCLWEPRQHQKWVLDH